MDIDCETTTGLPVELTVQESDAVTQEDNSDGHSLLLVTMDNSSQEEVLQVDMELGIPSAQLLTSNDGAADDQSELIACVESNEREVCASTSCENKQEKKNFGKKLNCA